MVFTFENGFGLTRSSMVLVICFRVRIGDPMGDVGLDRTLFGVVIFSTSCGRVFVSGVSERRFWRISNNFFCSAD